MQTKKIKVENLTITEPKNPENFYLEIELEDKGQDFLKLQLDKEGNAVGASPFFSSFCHGLKIDIDSIFLNWAPNYNWKNNSGQLKYKVIDYTFLLPTKEDFTYKGESAFIGSFERFEDVGIAEDCKLNLNINDTDVVHEFCVKEADDWFNGYEDNSIENRLLFAIILYRKLLEKYSTKKIVSENA